MKRILIVILLVVFMVSCTSIAWDNIPEDEKRTLVIIGVAGVIFGGVWTYSVMNPNPTHENMLH